MSQHIAKLSLRGIAAAMSLLAAQAILAQDDADVVTLSPFLVEGKTDGYRAVNSVGATRFNTAIKDIPLNVSVTTRELIDDRAVNDLKDALRYDASISRDNDETAAVSDSRMRIRSFGAPVRRNGSVASDGPIDNANVERIEVVKGPSSLLYGIGNPGGVVNYVTKQPLPEYRASAKATIGSDELYRIEGDFTGPFGSSEGTLYRVSASHQSNDSFRRFEHFESLFIAPSLLIPVGEDSSITLEGSYYDIDSSQPRLVSGTFGALSGSNSVLTDLDESFNVAGPDANAPMEFKNVTLTFDHKISPSVDFRFVASDSSSDQIIDSKTGHFPLRSGFRGESFDVPSITIWPAHLEKYVDSVQYRADVLGRFSMGETNHKLLFGLDYSETDYQIRNWSLGSAWVALDPFEFSNTPDAFFGMPSFDPNTWNASGNHNPSTSVDKAVYIVDQISLADNRISIIAGARYDEITLDKSGPREQTWNEVSPQIGATFQLNEDVNAFLSYSTSVSPIIGFSDETGDPFEPLIGESFEAGFKFELLEGAFSGSISYFDIEMQNKVVGQWSFDESRSIQTQNGTDIAQGVDLEVYYSATEDFQIVLGYVNQKVEVGEGPINSSGVDTLKGFPTKNAPENKLTLWAKHTFDVGEGADNFEIAGGYMKVGSRLGLGWAFDSFEVYWPEYDRFDLMFGYKFKMGETNAKLQLNIENLFDERYVEAQGFYGRPTSAVASLNFDW